MLAREYHTVDPQCCGKAFSDVLCLIMSEKHLQPLTWNDLSGSHLFVDRREYDVVLVGETSSLV